MKTLEEEVKRQREEDQLSGGTLGELKNESVVEEEKKQYFDDEGKEIDIEAEIELLEKTLDLLLNLEEDSIIAYRGDRKFEKDVTNQYLINLIKDVQEAQRKVKKAEASEGDPDAVSAQ